MAFLSRKPAAQDPQQLIQDCLRKRDYPGAVAAFKTLLKTNPKSTQMRMRYADTLVLAGNRKDAIEQYKQVAEEMAESGYLVKAIATFKKIVKLDPSQSDVVEHLAKLDAERHGHAPQMEVSVPTPEPVATTGAVEFGFEEFDESAEEFDIGGGIELGVGGADEPSAAPAPTTPAPTIEEQLDELPPEVDLDALTDLSPDELGTEEVPDAPTPDFDLAPDVDLAPDDEPEAEIGVMPESELEAPALEPELGPDLIDDQGAEMEPAEDFGVGAATALADPATVNMTAEEAGLDFGVGGATSEPAVEESPSSGGGLDFSFGDSAPATETAPAPSSSETGLGLDFGFGAATPETQPDEAQPDEVTAEPATELAAAEPEASAGFGFGAEASAEEAGAAPVGLDDPFGGDGEDLLGLLGDDIDSMLDNIMNDVGSDTANAPLELAPVETEIALFAHLAIDEFIEILKMLDRQTVKAGEMIVREGEAGHSMFILSSGEVEATVLKDGAPIVVATLHDGDFFGEMAVLSDAPRSATVTARKNSELLVLERDHLQEIFSRHPEVEAKIRLANDERVEKNRSRS